MNFRVAMLNMEQDHKRWDLRRSGKFQIHSN